MCRFRTRAAGAPRIHAASPASSPPKPPSSKNPFHREGAGRWLAVNEDVLPLLPSSALDSYDAVVKSPVPAKAVSSCRFAAGDTEAGRLLVLVQPWRVPADRAVGIVQPKRM